MTEQVHQIVAQFSPRVSASTDLLKSGILDSLTLMKLLTVLEARFDLRIALEDVDIGVFRSIETIAELVAARRSSPPPVLEPTPVVVATPPIAEALLDDLQRLFRSELAVRVDDPDQDLFESGVLDSMTLVQLILQLESTFQVSLPLQTVDLARFRSLRTIAELVAESGMRAGQAHG